MPFHLEGEDPSYLVVGGLLFDVLSGELTRLQCTQRPAVCTASKQAELQLSAGSRARHTTLSQLSATRQVLRPCPLQYPICTANTARTTRQRRLWACWTSCCTG